MGTSYCDSFSGICECLPNVEGEKCDRCAADHYNFESGLGCLPCECGVASNFSQCDDATGKCACKPGVGGRQCDRCLPGFYNYGPEGCQSCSCNTNLARGLGCNPITGQCECLRNVVGEKCDSCPPRWIFIEDHGCEACDGCTHGLLDVTDSLEMKLDPVIEELNSIAQSFYTTQKLKRLEQEIEELKPEVLALDPRNNNLSEQTNEVDSLEADARNHKKKANYLTDTAERLKNTSEELLKAINDDSEHYREVFLKVGNTIEEVQDLADNLGSEDNSNKNAQSIDDAKAYLERIELFDPESLKKASPKEQTCKIDEVLGQVEKFSKPVEDQEKRLDGFLEAKDDFNGKLEDLRKHSRDAIVKSISAESLNKKNRDSRLPQKIENIEKSIDDSKSKLKEAKDYNIESRKLLANHDLSIENLEKLGKEELKDLTTDVDKIILEQALKYDVLKDDENGNILKAHDHALQLLAKKEQIENGLNYGDSERGDAVKAVHAYAEIGSNVEIAQNKSNNAEKTVRAAKDLTTGIVDKASKSLSESNELSKSGHDSLADVQNDLEPRMTRANDNIDRIKNDLEKVEKTLKNVGDSLDSLKPEPLTDTWRGIELDALNSGENVAKSKQILEPIIETLEPSAKMAQKIPKEIEDTNKDISQALSQVNRVGDTVPEILDTMDRLEKKQDDLDKLSSKLGEDVDRLKRQIAQARQLANSIKVGVQFMPNTTLELEPPRSLQSQAFNTKFSTYFKTDHPNGLLMYLGNEQKGNERTKRDDFMAIEIENGYPVLIVDFDNNPQRIINSKRVDDNNWYEAIVERKGKDIKFMIREQDEITKQDKITTKEDVLSGGQSNFDLDENSRLIVGGYSDFQIPSEIKQSSFEGEVQDLKIGDEHVGLWNFIDGENLHGSREREQLVSREQVHTGYRFGGNGYVALDAKPFNFRSRKNSISFKFKTGRDSPNGLLFFVGDDPNYISVKLHEGSVMFEFKFDQAAEVVSIKTENQFNDDEWHHVEASRDGGSGALNVDGFNLYQQTLFYQSGNIQSPDVMYIGGFPERVFHSKAIGPNFEGCIDGVEIDSRPIDLSRNLQVFDALPGCPEKFSSVVAFANDQYGYTRHKNFTVNNNKLHINLKFRTIQSKGIIFYGINGDQSSSISLTLDEGILVLRSSKMELNTESDKWNDGNWHVVTAEHDQRKLKLSIDDTHEYTSTEAPLPLIVSYGEIYFGGLPSNFRPVKGALPNTAYFTGCIQDVTINTNTVNFASSHSKSNAILDQCPRGITEYELNGSKIYYPDGSSEEVSFKDIIDERNDFDDNENIIPDEKEEEKIITTQRTKVEATPRTTTTTTQESPIEETTRIYSEEEKHPKCYLPAIPKYDVDFDSAGFRFGTGNESFIELVSQLKEDGGSHINTYAFSLKFRTSKPNGLIFFAANDNFVISDFISIHLKDGYVIYSFKCGNSFTTLSSVKQYDNNEWTELIFTREKMDLSLTVNDATQRGRIPEKCRHNLARNMLVGGVPADDEADIAQLIFRVDPKKSIDQFFGCIKDIKLNNNLLVKSISDLANPLRNTVLPCSDNVEEGCFFGKSGGFVKLQEKFNVGEDLKISMDIKPRNLTGLLTSVHGKKTYLIVEMVKGNIHFTVEGGDNARSTIFFSDEDKSLCDGNWHSGEI